MKSWNKYLNHIRLYHVSSKVVAVVSRLVTRVMNKINCKTLTTRDMRTGWHFLEVQPGHT